MACSFGTLSQRIWQEVLLQCSRRQVCMVHLIVTVVPVPQVMEEILEVIKVILQEQCQQVRFFLLTACGTGCGLHGKGVLPTVSSTRECWRIFSSDSVWEGSCGLHAKSACCPTAPTREV